MGTINTSIGNKLFGTHAKHLLAYSDSPDNCDDKLLSILFFTMDLVHIHIIVS